MDFYLNEEQRKFRQEVREFSETRLMPNSFEWDDKGHFPLEEIKEMAKKGWLGIPWSKEYGGMGKDFLSYAVALEEISRADAGGTETTAVLDGDEYVIIERLYRDVVVSYARTPFGRLGG